MKLPPTWMLVTIAALSALLILLLACTLRLQRRRDAARAARKRKKQASYETVALHDMEEGGEGSAEILGDAAGWRVPVAPGEGRLRVAVGAVLHMGWGGLKTENQDRFVVAQGDSVRWDSDGYESGATPGAVEQGAPLWAGVYDGHGTAGLPCAQALEQRLHSHFGDALGASVEAAMKSACDVLQAELKVEKAYDAMYSGSTAVFAYLEPDGNAATIGQCGDSRALIVHPNEDGSHHDAFQPIQDHSFDNDEEAARVRALGGTVKANRPGAPLRVWGDESTLEPGLMVSRSLGDCRSHELGCSSEPQVLTVPLAATEDGAGVGLAAGSSYGGLREGQRMAIVMGTDGIFDALDKSSRGAYLANERVRRHVLNAESAQAAADALLDDSLRQWALMRRADNISAVVLFVERPAADREGA